MKLIIFMFFYWGGEAQPVVKVELSVESVAECDKVLSHYASQLNLPRGADYRLASVCVRE